jgi:hypothetical protein
MKRDINYLNVYVIDGASINSKENHYTTDLNVIEYYRGIFPEIKFSTEKGISIVSPGHCGVYLLGRKIM